MKLTISQIDKVLYSGDAESVTVPATGGTMTILAHHMPLITTLAKGSVIVKTTEGKTETFAVTAGFLEVGKEETVVLV
jgi:F-type H+-transporting ATPase subunit epsilon